MLDKPSLIYVLLCPERSSFNASFSLTKGLKSKGFQIVYIGPPNYCDYVESQGFSYKSLALSSYLSAQIKGRKHLFKTLNKWRDERNAIKYYSEACKKLVQQMEELFVNQKPILILMNPLILLDSIAAVRSNIPIIALNTTLASTLNFSVPPVFMNACPKDEPTLEDRFFYAKAWLRLICKAWYKRFFADKIVRIRYGLPPRCSLTSEVKRQGAKVRWGEYGPCLDVPELVLSSSEIDFKQCLVAKNRTYVGACVDLNRDDGIFDWTNINQRKYLVYCSLGTYSSVYPQAKQLFTAVIDAIKNSEDYELIVQVSSTLKAADVEDLPSHIHIVENVPQLEILKYANIFITHGGFSSVREAIYFGVPMIVFPFWFDQPGNAARIVHHGLGVSANITEVNRELIASLIREIGKPAYKDAIIHMQKAFQKEEACQAGVQFIVDFLGNHSPIG